jgi:hypothetical protein
MNKNATGITYIQLLTALFLTANCSVCIADSWGPFNIIETKPVSEVWLSPGFYTYHFQTDKDLNNNNLGLGAEYRYSTTNAITAGSFRNSVRHTSNYTAWYWQPLEFGDVRFGALFGLINGYPNALEGGWFPFALPVVSFEYKNIGVSFTLVPSYQDVVYGSLTMQFRLRLY